MPMGLVIVFLVVFLVFILLVNYYKRDNRIKREMRAARLVPVAEFDERRAARLQGAVRYLDEPLEAPLTGRHCAYYVVTVEEYRSHGKSGSWREIIHETEGRDFLLDDGTGTALIRMAGAEPVVVKDVHFRSGTFNDATPGLEAFLARHGHSSSGWIFNRSLRYREGVLEEHEPVAVCGRGVREPDPDPRTARGGYRDSATRLVMSMSIEMPLYVSDDPSVLG